MGKLRPRPKCIIFDCDNVLVNTEIIMISVLIDYAGEHGIIMDVNEGVKLFSGRHMGETIQMLEQQSGIKLPTDFEETFRKRAYSEFEKSVTPVEGVPELLETLTLPFCVASNGPREKIKLTLGITGLLKFFQDEHIFSGYEIRKWKPDPALYIHAAKEMGFKPEDCVVIEDSLPGISAAIAGGFSVYGYTNGLNRLEIEELGATVIFEMAGLKKILMD